MPSLSLTLPYVAQDTSRKKPFTYDIEVAAILCVAEAKRKKLRILGTPPEKLSFISKLYYPLWAVPWNNECLVVDGLGIFSYTIAYRKTPDVSTFVEDLKRGAAIREFYRSALKSHAKTFEDFVEVVHVPVESIVASKDLLSAFWEYVKQQLSSEERAAEPIVVVPPKLDEKAVLGKTEELLDHWKQIQSEIKGLQYAITVLHEETELHEQKILCEIEEIQETFEKGILSIKSVVEERVKQLMEKRDTEIKAMMRVAEKELEAALKERERYEQKLEKLDRNRSVYQKRKDMRKHRGNEVGVTYWDHKIKVCENKISHVMGKIKVLSRFIERTRKQNELGVKRLNETYQAMIIRERKTVSDAEVSRDSQIEVIQKEMRELRLETTSITNLIGQLIEKKRLQASELKNVTMPWKLERPVQIFVPFYLFRYETEAKSRYYVYPPVIAMDYEGIVRKIQKTIWSFSLESRIKLLLRPRSKALERMFTSTFAEGMKRDKALAETMYKLGSSNNLLKVQDFGEKLTKGIEELKVEGWINQEEKDAILKVYVP